MEARQASDFAAFWPILVDTLEQKYGEKPTHTLEEIESIKELFGDAVRFIGGYYAGELVAGIVVFVMNSTAAHIMYSAQTKESQEFCALNVVVLEALRCCTDLGLRYLNYGISSLPGTGGRELNEGLYSFKRNCGFRGVLREIYELAI